MTVAVRRSSQKYSDAHFDREDISTKKGGLNGFIDSLSTDLLLGLTSVSIGVSLLTSSASPLEVWSVSLWGFLVIVYLVFSRHTNKKISQLQTWVAKYGLMPFLTGLLTCIYLFDSMILPSHALFFDNVRTKINTMFANTAYATTGTKAVDLATYAMEALMLGYILYGVVKAIQAGRDDEDWKVRFVGVEN